MLVEKDAVERSAGRASEKELPSKGVDI